MSDAYQSLKERFQKIYRLQHLGAIASWDQSTMMPKGGNKARGEAQAELSSLLHTLLTDHQVRDWIEQARQNASDEQTSVSLREMERAWLNASVIEEELVKAKTIAANQCEHAWRTQRQEDAWQGFRKNFKEVVKLTIEEAQIRSEQTNDSPYDALMDLYEPDMNSKQIDQLFGDLTSWLPGYIQQALEKQKSDTVIKPEGAFSVESQKSLGLEVMKLLGFDFDHGRIDVSTHPFCGGVSEDVRITTRYRESDFVEALMATIHETGHARYGQNLPMATRGLPVGRDRSMGIHESQSLFFEMQLSRSPEFLSRLQPLIIKHLCNGVAEPYTDLANLEKIYTRVRPGFIRVEADEITYPAHVILRYEIERDLINQKISVDDIPELWNQKMQEYLDIEVGHQHGKGCMQDIHWSMGAFGYFPSYTLGALYAAQFFAALKKEIPNINKQISRGDLAPVFDWLKRNIWSHGSYYMTGELVQNATGESLNTRYFKQHLEQRYL